MKFLLPRGMRDLEPEEFENINLIRNAFIESAKIFNFTIMEPSPLELLSTLESKSGPGITKEIYNFTDKGNREVALRFDITIGLTRYFASRRDLKIPAKIASFGGVWRYDEPQAGRYRFFHQWDIEIYGPTSTEADTEIIEFTSVFLNKLGLRNIVIEINSRSLLEEYIKKILKISKNDSIFEIYRAIDKIPKKGKLQVLKEYEDRIGREILLKIMEFADNRGSFDQIDKVIRPFGLSAWDEIEKITNSLKNKGVINVQINLGIVRGLDYYSGIVFEAVDTNNNFGSIVGGGRYNNLTEVFGRKDAGATGAAGGVERMIMAMKHQNIMRHLVNIERKYINFIIYDSVDLFGYAEHLASVLRRKNIPIEYDLLKRSFSKQIVEAENKKSKNIIILKKDEIENEKQIVLRNTSGEKDTKVKVDKNFDELIKELNQADHD
ncbi:MAG: histidine--tRNA ligase [Candidatus Nitrosocosmicus sp.]|jgi:histidyl-tRNA synthetase|uniref:histidine--tRNA ligase n=1 Tax=Candidatus Nitrosocosmicus sp. FF01 TaxID=3397670 RepID=UPI002A70D376|nr:histidine--tRNA ligase [Candidatus Nitrosocosmicus sp.]